MTQESDLSLRILRLEQKLESYQKLHAEELDELRLALAELKRQVLSMAALQQQAAPLETQVRGFAGKGEEPNGVGR